MLKRVNHMWSLKRKIWSCCRQNVFMLVCVYQNINAGIQITIFYGMARIASNFFYYWSVIGSFGNSSNFFKKMWLTDVVLRFRFEIPKWFLISKDKSEILFGVKSHRHVGHLFFEYFLNNLLCRRNGKHARLSIGIIWVRQPP